MLAQHMVDPSLHPDPILLVDDHSGNRLVASIMLEILGYKCDIAHNGVEALDYFAKNDYSIILMDVQMPELDGLETTRRIRDIEATSGKRPSAIIALTAHPLSLYKQKCLDAGMNAFLNKPFQSEELAQILRGFEDHVDA